jgi:hypothetical protein
MEIAEQDNRFYVTGMKIQHTVQGRIELIHAFSGIT